jgi:hypothetical protein
MSRNLDATREGWGYGMTWITPQFERREVNEAGRILVADINAIPLDLRNHALEVINNWRSAHSFPLHCLKMTLITRAKKCDKNAIVAQRLKRLQSIAEKLRIQEWMKLTQMQDIGGCRAVVENMPRLRKLIRYYKEADKKNPTRGHILAKPNDYINDPKPDGYRSHQLVYRYRSTNPKYTIYNDQKIEVQLRTRLQHAWATAVETVATFRGENLKGGIGPPTWKRFFALMGTAIALREKCPPVPDTPTDKDELIQELRLLTETLNVHAELQGWLTSLNIAKIKEKAGFLMFLLEIDPVARCVTYLGFTKEDANQAPDAYLAKEKEISAKGIPGAQVVLVQTSSIKALRTAFPNYYLDTTVFLNALKFATK